MNAYQKSPSGYRGVEQALLLLGALDHKNVAGVAVELLEHDHPRVLVTAAWALRVLQVKETLPSMLDRAIRVSHVFLGGRSKRATMGGAVGMDQVAHLFDAFGQMKYREAEDLLRKYIPKNLDIGENSRPAAITAIGKLYQDDPDPELVGQLVARLHDWESDPAEINLVCSMSAIALGRMNAESAMKDLEKYFQGDPPRGSLTMRVPGVFVKSPAAISRHRLHRSRTRPALIWSRVAFALRRHERTSKPVRRFFEFFEPKSEHPAVDIYRRLLC